MNGACLLYGRIPHAKDLTIDIAPRQKSWMSIGGKKYRKSSWNNFVAIYGETDDIQYTTKYSYNEHLQDLKNGTIRIILPGYEFTFFRIVFPENKSAFTLKYSTKKSVRCKRLDATVVDIVSCTNANKINSKCKVKCTKGFAPSPYLYQNDVNFPKSESVLPYMMTKCKGNGFNPPSWDHDITIADFEPFFAEDMINPIILPVDSFFPSDVTANNIKNNRSDIPGWMDVLEFDTENPALPELNIPDRHKCVDLKIVADICFHNAWIVDMFLGHISACNYPVDYLLELFGENQGEGIDPDTLPTPAPKTFNEKLQELDQNEKAAFLFKLSEFDPTWIDIKCWKNLTETLLQQLKRQTRNVKSREITNAVNQLWGSYLQYLYEECDLGVLLQTAGKSNCLTDSRLCGWSKAKNDYLYSCADFSTAKRKFECLGCRNPKPGTCTRTKSL
uniref:uncharacterized protein LOC120347671 isoform X1 n=1 Tax=Styela clava TaxID=7725 RepID=UPI001939272E|nr:uncharacterized protein LOC120347671 isoform X1 [Styela clava]